MKRWPWLYRPGLFNRNLFFDFNYGADFTSIPPVRDIVKQFSSGAPPTV
jgi:hypothetical protein